MALVTKSSELANAYKEIRYIYLKAEEADKKYSQELGEQIPSEPKLLIGSPKQVKTLSQEPPEQIKIITKKPPIAKPVEIIFNDSFDDEESSNLKLKNNVKSPLTSIEYPSPTPEYNPYIQNLLNNLSPYSEYKRKEYNYNENDYDSDESDEEMKQHDLKKKINF